jgi:hypothetical protein
MDAGVVFSPVHGYGPCPARHSVPATPPQEQEVIDAYPDLLTLTPSDEASEHFLPPGYGPIPGLESPPPTPPAASPFDLNVKAEEAPASLPPLALAAPASPAAPASLPPPASALAAPASPARAASIALAGGPPPAAPICIGHGHAPRRPPRGHMVAGRPRPLQRRLGHRRELLLRGGAIPGLMSPAPGAKSTAVDGGRSGGWSGARAEP